jgi:hypothetical protein
MQRPFVSPLYYEAQASASSGAAYSRINSVDTFACHPTRMAAGG